MQLFDENAKIIEKLEKVIEDLAISNLEEVIRNNEMQYTSWREKRYDANNKLLRIKSRIHAINYNLICENESLRNKLIYVDNMCMRPCGIAYMDMSLNNRMYLVQNFYNELNIKCSEQPLRYELWGLKPNPNGRFLKVEQLEDTDKKVAVILDEYLKLCSIGEQIEMLIDFVKCIQFNYIADV